MFGFIGFCLINPSLYSAFVFDTSENLLQNYKISRV